MKIGIIGIFFTVMAWGLISPALSQNAQPTTPDTAAPVISMEDLDLATRMGVIDSLIRKKKYKTAELELKKWIEQEPANDTIRIRLATLYESKKYFQEAADIYERLVNLDSQNKQYLKKVISLFTKMRYYTIAIKYCDRYIEQEPTSLAALEKKAALLTLEKKYRESTKTYEELLGKAPHRDDIRLKLAADYTQLQKYSPAASIYEDLVKTSPDNTEYQRGLIFALYNDGQHQAAEKLIREFMRTQSRDHEVMETYCNILAQQQRYDEAINYYYRLLQGDPLDIQVKWKIAQIYAWKGSYFIALSLYDQIMRTGQVPPEILRERARVLGWAHRYRASLQQYSSILEKDPADSLTQVEFQAKKAYYNHRYSSSINYYNQLIDRDTANWDARIQLAQLYSTFRRWDQGRGHYQHIIQAMPTFNRVKAALNKLDILTHQVNVDWYTEYQFGKSGGLDNPRLGKLKMDYEVYASHVTAAVPPFKDLYFSLDYSFNRHHFRSQSDQTLHKTSLAVALYKQPPFWVTGEYTYVMTPEGYDKLHLYRLRLNYRLLDMHQLMLRLGQQEQYPNAAAFSQQLQQQYLGATYRLQLSSRFSSRLQYDYLTYSDSLENKQQILKVQATYGTMFQRAGIDFTYGIRYTLSKYDSEENTALVYFSPDRYAETYFIVDWTEYLKGFDFSWGEEKVYYNLMYTFNLDGDVYIRNSFDGLLNVDVSPRLNVRLGGRLEVSQRHQQRQAYLKGLYYF